MFRQNMIFLLLGHIIGDFYAQTNVMSEKKQSRFRWVLIHSLIYFIVFMMLAIPFVSYEAFEVSMMASILHAIIDICKFIYVMRMEKMHKYNQNVERKVFLIDQLLHLLCLFGISYFMVSADVRLQEMAVLSDFFDMVGIAEVMAATWILTLLIVHKPANILIQKVIGTFKPANNQNDFKRDHNAGRLIGTIERIIMVILISINQFSAIGLVLTAKSIARYDRISKDEAFAEYYLLGTLISAAIVIAAATILLQ